MHKLFTFLVLCVCSVYPLYALDVEALYLTWIRDPTSTMVVQWHTKSIEIETVLYYRKRGSIEPWKVAGGEAERFQKSSRLIHRLELEGLEPATAYTFRFENIEGSKEYWFRTMPKNDEEPIRFVMAGDAYYFYYLFAHMNTQIAKTNPDFIVVGGDIAYTENHPSFFKGAAWQLRRWQTFFNAWRTTLVGEDGRLIPFLAVLGNHDIKKRSAELTLSLDRNPAFFQLFTMPEKLKAYRALDFGSYLSLLFLDSGHYSLVSDQTDWLRKALEERSTTKVKLASYHIGAYPCVYDYNASIPRRIRSHWVPLFEEYGVDTVFEHHCHAYKRTHRIKDGQIDPSGVLYLGDGCWGTLPRTPHEGLWYTARVGKFNHFWLVTLLEGDIHFESRDIYGKTIEVVTSSKNCASKAPDLSTNLGSASASSSL